MVENLGFNQARKHAHARVFVNSFFAAAGESNLGKNHPADIEPQGGSCLLFYSSGFGSGVISSVFSCAVQLISSEPQYLQRQMLTVTFRRRCTSRYTQVSSSFTPSGLIASPRSEHLCDATLVFTSYIKPSLFGLPHETTSLYSASLSARNCKIVSLCA